ncbi:hypothetical protein WDL1P1_00362 (plasmid) [Variovorax sp. WDL1]|nr:hypothetical protein CHC06_05935 [Variovorax sp. B2]PNG51185.1 hypothetical protein CHC07_05841 [Variovorax sp. B4]VTV17402.1 hypothetical protein WDL1P1_00362 [Variovorax sp. WDL1]
MRKQSAQDREIRLSEGRCPVHGCAMHQVGLAKGERRLIVGCPRGDCEIRGTAERPAGPVVLLPEHEHLLAGE